ncbi:MAG: alkaline phosphatase family protein [Actinomycetota bacterium]|nr:alkaline phosphatase family protein [Actinomycetota bacterium]
MPVLLLGPMLRYADETCATVWVETDAACDVTVLGHTVSTFHVRGHHYALVRIEGLTPDSVHPYEVELDGERVWPEPGSVFPPSVVRTTTAGNGPLHVAFGSCRVTRPHTPPYTCDPEGKGREVGVDALHALGTRMCRQQVELWPDTLLLLGDQVYADEVSPQTLRFIRARRSTRKAPGEGIADFEEYCALYQEAWSDPTVRWLLSTVPSAMIFDDHDVHDDWNTSDTWRRQKQAQPWWEERITGALSAYWIYQHLGNMQPSHLDEDGMLAHLHTLPDGGEYLRKFALWADAEADGRKGYRWSYARDHGRTRLLVIDSRAGRVLEQGDRQMVDEPEWQWITEQASGELDHLVIASTLPVFLPEAVDDLEAWNEAVCDGAWGERFRWPAEKLRQAADLEHWGAFRRSLTALVELLAEVGSGRHGTAPASIVVLSGDVHYSYLAEVDLSGQPDMDMVSAVYQAVCSPLRNPIQHSVQWGDRFARTKLGGWVGRRLAASAGVPQQRARWRISQGPWFDNGICTLTLSGRNARLTVEQTRPGDGSDPQLVTVYAGDLASAPLPG